jgi:hypothetical protein
MKKVVRLTETELVRLVNKVINEQGMGLLDELKEINIDELTGLVKNSGGSCVLSKINNRIVVSFGPNKYVVRNVTPMDQTDHFGNVSLGMESLNDILKSQKQVPGKVVSLKQGMERQNWTGDSLLFTSGNKKFGINARVLRGGELR